MTTDPIPLLREARRDSEDTTMTDNREQAVDVLAVLDEVMGNDPPLSPEHAAWNERVTRARTAVAELIEADRELDAASEAWDAVPGPPDGCVDDRDYDSAEYRRLCTAIERRRAALTRLAPREDAK